MSDIYHFRNGGFEVRVLNKKDVLECIENNILDKEVALEIVKHCEIDATNFIRGGRWAGIPFMGNIRIPKTTQLLMSEESRELLNSAKENSDRNEYLLFARNYIDDCSEKVNRERYYMYSVSKFVGKNRQFFVSMSEKLGDNLARLICYTFSKTFFVFDE